MNAHETFHGCSTVAFAGYGEAADDLMDNADDSVTMHVSDDDGMRFSGGMLDSAAYDPFLPGHELHVDSEIDQALFEQADASGELDRTLNDLNGEGGLSNYELAHGSSEGIEASSALPPELQALRFGGYYNADGTYHYDSDNTDRDPETGAIVRRW